MSKIIVFGDSIAYGKWDREGGWVARLRKAIDQNYYNLQDAKNFQVYNLSIPGEVAIRMVDRFEEELKMRIPLEENTNNKNLIILAVGINDSCPNNWMTLAQTPKENFKKSLRQMITIAKNNKCQIICIGLTPVNKEKSKGLLFSNEEVQKFDAYISEVCKELQIEKIDLFDDLKKNSFTNLLVDGVHPNEKGHEMIFAKVREFLKNLIEI